MAKFTQFTQKQIESLIDAVEAEISVGPMDPIHAEDRHAWDKSWHMEPPPEPREDHMHLQGRRSCARRAVMSVLKKLPESRDTKLLNFLEERTKESKSGVTFQWTKYVEEGYVVEKGYRVMSFHKVTPYISDLRAAIVALQELCK